MIFSFVVTQAFCLLGIVYGGLEAAVGRYAGTDVRFRAPPSGINVGLSIAEWVVSSISTHQLMSALQRAVRR